MMKDIGLAVVLTVVLLIANNFLGNIATLPDHFDTNLPPLKIVEEAEAPVPAPAGDTTEETTGNREIGLAAGAKAFKKCKSYHNAAPGAKAKTGPNLWNVVGRAKASIEGFKYSAALKEIGGDWTEEDLDVFLKKPKDFAPGNKMYFSGIKKHAKRANLIGYLATLKD